MVFLHIYFVGGSFTKMKVEARVARIEDQLILDHISGPMAAFAGGAAKVYPGPDAFSRIYSLPGQNLAIRREHQSLRYTTFFQHMEGLGWDLLAGNSFAWDGVIFKLRPMAPV